VVIDKFELVSSVKLGRNNDESNLSEEHHDQDDHNHTAFVYEDLDATDTVVAVTPDLERKSDETEPTSLEQERNQMLSFLKGQGYKNVQKL
ncbi:hypothetical protein Tco_0480077, partial [Tanacetum coccineum]